MQEVIITTMTRQDLESLVIDCVKVCLTYHKTDKQNDGNDSNETTEGRRILSLDQFCQYTGLSRQTAYKLTSAQKVPHSKRGKRLYFDRNKVDEWLLENKVATQSEILKKAEGYTSKSHRRRRA